jgi:hypothetical protein
MDTLDALPMTLDLEKRFEPKANFGYSFQYWVQIIYLSDNLFISFCHPNF